MKIIADLDISATGIKSLRRLTRLESLTLDNTSGRSVGGISDDTLGFVEWLSLLTSLNLEGHPITDAGMERIGWPAGLVNLNLSGAKITDGGLATLKPMISLRRLVAMECRLTSTGIADFRRAAPQCAVVFGEFDEL